MIENNDLNKDNLSKKDDKYWWKSIMVFYVKATSWIVLPSILAMIGGKYVSKSMGSQVLFFVFIMIGFGITCFGIYREIKQYKKSIENK